MAQCDQGYLCDVCGDDVAEIPESDLYLRYVLGQVRPEELHRAPERHIRCHPVLAQYIVAPAFTPVVVDGPLGKQNLDPTIVAAEEELVTRAWQRLQELHTLGLNLIEYPLPEVLDRWHREAEALANARRRAADLRVPTPSAGATTEPTAFTNIATANHGGSLMPGSTS